MLVNLNIKNSVLIFFVFFLKINAQQNDIEFGQIDIPNPSSYIENYQYDSERDLYYYSTKIGDYDINYPVIQPFLINIII